MGDYEGVLITETTCPRCGQIVTPKAGPGRPPKRCSQACRRAAYEEHRAAATGAIAVRTVTIEKPIKPTRDELADLVMTMPGALRTILDRIEGDYAGELREAGRWKDRQTIYATAHRIAQGPVPNAWDTHPTTGA